MVFLCLIIVVVRAVDDVFGHRATLDVLATEGVAVGLGIVEAGCLVAVAKLHRLDTSPVVGIEDPIDDRWAKIVVPEDAVLGVLHGGAAVAVGVYLVVLHERIGLRGGIGGDMHAGIEERRGVLVADTVAVIVHQQVVVNPEAVL